MIYYEEKGEFIVKYEVKIAKEKVEKICNEISNDSGINMKHYSGTVSGEEFNKLLEYSTNYHYKNFNSRYLMNGYYKVEYDEPGELEVVVRLRKLLSGDTSVLQEILNPPVRKLSYTKESVYKELEKVTDDLRIMPTTNTANKIKRLQKQLEDYDRIEEEQQRQDKLIEKYYYNIINSIKLEEIGRMKKDEIFKVFEFIDEMNENTINKEVDIKIKEKIME